MAVSKRRSSTRRTYQPKLEALEALRLLDAAAAAGLIPIPVEHLPLPEDLTSRLAEPPLPLRFVDSDTTPLEHVHAAWDQALADESPELPWLPTRTDGGLDREAAIASGLRQLDRYMASAWTRAGISLQHHEDCSQGVHATMLQQIGRARFDQMLADVGRDGVTRTLNRDTELGPDFFRAVDMIKKRAQRQRTHLALDDQAELSTSSRKDAPETWRNALNEAITQKLETREAELIRATLNGFTPAEIADQWGLAAKTISNEKTRVFKKLRDALVAELAD